MTIKSSLADIESAVDALPPIEQQELLLFIAARMRANSGRLPPPRRFAPEQFKDWIAADETELRKFDNGASQ